MASSLSAYFRNILLLWLIFHAMLLVFFNFSTEISMVAAWFATSVERERRGGEIETARHWFSTLGFCQLGGCKCNAFFGNGIDERTLETRRKFPHRFLAVVLVRVKGALLLQTIPEFFAVAARGTDIEDNLTAFFVFAADDDGFAVRQFERLMFGIAFE